MNVGGDIMKRLATLCLGLALLGSGVGCAEPGTGSGTLPFDGRVTIEEANEMIYALKEKLKREPEPLPPPLPLSWETPVITLTENVSPELQYPEPVYRPVAVAKKRPARAVAQKRPKSKKAKTKTPKARHVPAKATTKATDKAPVVKPTTKSTTKATPKTPVAKTTTKTTTKSTPKAPAVSK
jgi:hypothetical protein